MGTKLKKLIRLNVFIFWTMDVLLICSSCSYTDVKQDDPFRLLYPELSAVSSAPIQSGSAEVPYLTLSCHKMPFSVLARVLSDKFSLGLVFSEKLQDKFITAEFKKTALSDVLNVISRQLDVDIVRVGNTYYVGSLRSEDRGILVRRVYGYDKDDLKRVVDSSLSEKGKASVLSSGVVTVFDHDSVVRRLSEMLDYIDAVDQPVWILQLVFVILRRDALIEGGAKVTTSGTMSYNVSDNSFDLKDLKLDALVNAIMQSSCADIHASPMLLCRDGSKSVWKNGQRVPIPKKTVSSYGVVSVSNYDYVDVGFTVEATVSCSRRGSGNVILSITKSEIESYVDEAPVTAQNVYNLNIDMLPMKPYLLGELQLFKELNSQTNILNFGKDKGKSVVQLWGQLYKIQGGSSEVYSRSPRLVKINKGKKDK